MENQPTLDRLHGVLNHLGQVHRLHVQAKLAGNDAGDVEHVLDDLRQRRDVSFHRVHRPDSLLSGQQIRLHHAHVSHDRVQRGP